uniref:Uncharacterized protein n=1 Tax=Rhipicephalus zambeziensis TaxID=60191 RepID=A0A224YHI0_9ACAR
MNKGLLCILKIYIIAKHESKKLYKQYNPLRASVACHYQEMTLFRARYTSAANAISTYCMITEHKEINSMGGHCAGCTFVFLPKHFRQMPAIFTK